MPDATNVISLLKAAKLADPVKQEHEVMEFIGRMSQSLEKDLLQIVTPEFVAIRFSHMFLHVGEDVPQACEVVGYVDVPEELRIIARTAYQLRVECRNILLKQPATYRKHEGEWAFGPTLPPEAHWRNMGVLSLTTWVEKSYSDFLKEHSVVPPNYTKSPSK